MHNLLIIGNGFDLAHNLKTSYNDFLKYIINSHLKKEWKENVLFTCSNNTIHKYEDFISQNISMLNLFLDYKNNFFKVLIQNHFTNNWSDIEELYIKELNLIIQKGVNVNFKSIKHLNDDFENIKRALEIYLSKETDKEVRPLDSFTYLFSKFNLAETQIVNFNYTNTLLKLYLKNPQSLRLVHIHGELNSGLNPIIFGYAADDNEARILINKNDNEYLRNIKKNCYKRTSNERKIRDYLDNKDKINVIIIGHSCGLSDKLILKQIFNHPNIKSIRILYHNDYEQYFQTQVNMDRIMCDDEKFKKLVNFEEEFKFPSYNNEKSFDRGKFQNYINRFFEEQKPLYFPPTGVS